jgi:hypothetical protein
MTTSDRDTIIEAIERSDRLIPHIPGFNEYAMISGVLTYVTPADDPMANKALLARLEPENAAAAIGKVKAYFKEKSKSFSWIVGPSTTPLDLGSRLLANGFKQLLTVDGMYLPDPTAKIDVDSSVKVSELPVDEPGPAVEIMALGFNTTMEVSRYFHKMMALSSPRLRTRIYIAHLEGIETPVACAYATYYPEQPISLLSGGATLPAYRGRGVYKALLMRRLADIASDGIETVIVLADQRTSAPICAKAGFVRVCELPMYVWRPEKRASS